MNNVVCAHRAPRAPPSSLPISMRAHNIAHLCARKRMAALSCARIAHARTRISRARTARIALAPSLEPHNNARSVTARSHQRSYRAHSRHRAHCCTRRTRSYRAHARAIKHLVWFAARQLARLGGVAAGDHQQFGVWCGVDAKAGIVIVG